LFGDRHLERPADGPNARDFDVGEDIRKSATHAKRHVSLGSCFTRHQAFDEGVKFHGNHRRIEKWGVPGWT
jgi:hypothetical protein